MMEKYLTCPFMAEWRDPDQPNHCQIVMIRKLKEEIDWRRGVLLDAQIPKVLKKEEGNPFLTPETSTLLPILLSSIPINSNKPTMPVNSTELPNSSSTESSNTTSTQTPLKSEAELPSTTPSTSSSSFSSTTSANSLPSSTSSSSTTSTTTTSSSSSSSSSLTEASSLNIKKPFENVRRIIELNLNEIEVERRILAEQLYIPEDFHEKTFQDGEFSGKCFIYYGGEDIEAKERVFVKPKRDDEEWLDVEFHTDPSCSCGDPRRTRRRGRGRSTNDETGTEEHAENHAEGETTKESNDGSQLGESSLQEKDEGECDDQTNENKDDSKKRKHGKESKNAKRKRTRTSKKTRNEQSESNWEVHQDDGDDENILFVPLSENDEGEEQSPFVAPDDWAEEYGDGEEVKLNEDDEAEGIVEGGLEDWNAEPEGEKSSILVKEKDKHGEVDQEGKDKKKEEEKVEETFSKKVVDLNRQIVGDYHYWVEKLNGLLPSNDMYDDDAQFLGDIPFLFGNRSRRNRGRRGRGDEDEDDWSEEDFQSGDDWNSDDYSEADDMSQGDDDGEDDNGDEGDSERSSRRRDRDILFDDASSSLDEDGDDGGEDEGEGFVIEYSKDALLPESHAYLWKSELKLIP
eukprot:TRINITY_DN1222_c0_g1_i2.p1 TRINITY_DN1222_c0_g1~~TRINITY_DN1222_c0_g1_i2.p1  ORF type:complete len:628 (-),score=171.79 TRINITY_DN1222_c0_g1_i2:35-1918(-)